MVILPLSMVVSHVVVHESRNKHVSHVNVQVNVCTCTCLKSGRVCSFVKCVCVPNLRER